MSDLLSKISGPLDKKACSYFFILTIFFFGFFILSLIGNIVILIKNRKTITFSSIVWSVYMLFSILIAYFVNRLMYTVCNKSFETA